jgi:hypothetical protein
MALTSGGAEVGRSPKNAAKSPVISLKSNLGRIEMGVFNAVKDGGRGDHGEPVDLPQGLPGIGLPGLMGDHDDGHRSRHFPAFLDHRGDADIVLPQDAGDLGEHPGAVQGGDAELIMGHQIIHGLDEAGGSEGRLAAQGLHPV